MCGINAQLKRRECKAACAVLRCCSECLNQSVLHAIKLPGTPLFLLPAGKGGGDGAREAAAGRAHGEDTEPHGCHAGVFQRGLSEAKRGVLLE